MKILSQALILLFNAALASAWAQVDVPNEFPINPECMAAGAGSFEPPAKAVVYTDDELLDKYNQDNPVNVPIRTDEAILAEYRKGNPVTSPIVPSDKSAHETTPSAQSKRTSPFPDIPDQVPGRDSQGQLALVASRKPDGTLTSAGVVAKMERARQMLPRTSAGGLTDEAIALLNARNPDGTMTEDAYWAHMVLRKERRAYGKPQALVEYAADQQQAQSSNGIQESFDAQKKYWESIHHTPTREEVNWYIRTHASESTTAYSPDVDQKTEASAQSYNFYPDISAPKPSQADNRAETAKPADTRLLYGNITTYNMYKSSSCWDKGVTIDIHDPLNPDNPDNGRYLSTGFGKPLTREETILPDDPAQEKKAHNADLAEKFLEIRSQPLITENPLFNKS